MITVPAIDLMEGRVVRLVRGDPRRARTYHADPVAVARRFEAEGARAIHVVDLDAALGRGRNRGSVADICAAVRVPVQVGGGLRDHASVQDVLDLGAARAVIGTAIEQADLVDGLVRRHGDRLVAALDVRGRVVAVDGWRSAGPPVAGAIETLTDAGVARFLVTSIAVDGTMRGPAIELYRELRRSTDRPLIASGGVGSAPDLHALAEVGVEAAVVGTAVYEGRVDLRAVCEIGGPA